jgi:cysteinyl-tRNA synthetase
MKALIERLVADGHAYVEQEHVLFSVPSMQDYGRLSKRPMDEMIAGARIEVAPYKRDAQDFVLWKPSRAGEPAWPSPCGIATAGRPGWHIECSAMSDYWLWTKAQGSLSQAGLSHPHQFDIHGGGIDLVFPHHENEIAQSRCAFHTPVMAKFWMHNGFLQVEGEKMSKSLGNFFTMHDLLKDWPGEVLRLNMLRTHYRQPLDWTVKGLEESKKILDNWYDVVDDEIISDGKPDAEFIRALSDDLNTPNALTQLHRLAGEVRGPASGSQIELKRTLRASAMLVGLLGVSKRQHLESDPRRIVVDENKVNSLIDARTAARKAKNFEESDRIRDELAGMGVVLKDSKDGTTWEIAR